MGRIVKQSVRNSLITLIISFILISQIGLAAEFGKITLPLGKVEVLTVGSEDWSRAMPRQALNVNDQIRTAAKSRCEISLTGGG